MLFHCLFALLFVGHAAAVCTGTVPAQELTALQAIAGEIGAADWTGSTPCASGWTGVSCTDSGACQVQYLTIDEAEHAYSGTLNIGNYVGEFSQLFQVAITTTNVDVVLGPTFASASLAYYVQYKAKSVSMATTYNCPLLNGFALQDSGLTTWPFPNGNPFSALTILWLDNNAINEPLPKYPFQQATGLSNYQLTLTNNDFYGAVPVEWGIYDFYQIDLSNNNLGGPFPNCIKVRSGGGSCSVTTGNNFTCGSNSGSPTSCINIQCGPSLGVQWETNNCVCEGALQNDPSSACYCGTMGTSCGDGAYCAGSGGCVEFMPSPSPSPAPSPAPSPSLSPSPSPSPLLSPSLSPSSSPSATPSPSPSVAPPLPSSSSLTSTLVASSGISFNTDNTSPSELDISHPSMQFGSSQHVDSPSADQNSQSVSGIVSDLSYSENQVSSSPENAVAVIVTVVVVAVVVAVVLAVVCAVLYRKARRGKPQTSVELAAASPTSHNGADHDPTVTNNISNHDMHDDTDDSSQVLPKQENPYDDMRGVAAREYDGMPDFPTKQQNIYDDMRAVSAMQASHGYNVMPTASGRPTVKNVTIGKTLGEGNFGKVVEGIYNNTPVAIKVIPNASDDDLAESDLMATLDHPNVIKMFGQFLHQGSMHIVMEVLPLGSLDSVVKDLFVDDKWLDVGTKHDIAIQVCSGMTYLAENSIIHRDLAARNVLMNRADDGRYIAKVADFGLSKKLFGNDYYTVQTDRQLPIKWMAPECLAHGVFSEKSDVYAFGVTCWEIFSNCKKPFSILTLETALEKIQTGKARLEQPEQCPDSVWTIIDTDCLAFEKRDRKPFAQVLKALQACEPASFDSDSTHKHTQHNEYHDMRH